MKTLLLVSVLSCLAVAGFSQQLTGMELLEKSIRYHDPKGQWKKARLHLRLTETRPKSPDRTTEVWLDNRAGKFRMEQLRDSILIVREVNGQTCSHSLNGSTRLSAEDIEKHRLTCERSLTIRNFYTYLWGLPMKLKDPGAIVHDEVETANFQGAPCLAVKINYAESVGKDTWYFYFNPGTYAMIGYRFYHDESKNDGEYITLEGEETVSGVRLPKKRTWYVNEGGELLGTDILEGEK